MTALTTITALIPMAITATDGLVYATLLTLFVVPTIYLGTKRKAKKLNSQKEVFLK